MSDPIFADIDDTNVEIEAWEVEDARLAAEGMSDDDRARLWESLGTLQ